MTVSFFPILFVCLADEYAVEPAVRNAKFLAEKITGGSDVEVLRLPDVKDDYNHSWTIAGAAYDDRKRFSCIVIEKSIGDGADGLIYATCQRQADKTLNKPLPIFRCLDEWGELGLVVPLTTTIPVSFERAIDQTA